jgi:hypothetical protein
MPKRIVFEAYPNPDAYGDVYVVSASGGRALNLTRNPTVEAGSADPVWSPMVARSCSSTTAACAAWEGRVWRQ